MARKRNPKGLGSYSRLKNGKVRWRLTRDGKTIERTANTDKELQEKIKPIINLPIIKENQKTDEWFNFYLENYVAPLKKAATYNQYESIYRVHIKPVIGHYKLITVKAPDIQNVISKMNSKGLSAATMRHAKKIMSCGFKRAYKEKMIPENPTIDIEIPTKQNKQRKVLSLPEISNLYEAMSQSRWIWSVKFALVTGLRRGELLALRWNNIEWDNKRIVIEKSNSVTGVGDTKSSKTHYVPLSDKAISYLYEQTEMLKAELNPIIINDDLTLKEDLVSSGSLVFPKLDGNMISPNTYYHTLKRYAAKAGVEMSPHSLRHTFVFLTRKNLSLKDIQYTLGHEKSTTTLDIYGDILNDDATETANKIDDVFKNIDEAIAVKPDLKIVK